MDFFTDNHHHDECDIFYGDVCNCKDLTDPADSTPHTRASFFDDELDELNDLRNTKISIPSRSVLNNLKKDLDRRPEPHIDNSAPYNEIYFKFHPEELNLFELNVLYDDDAISQQTPENFISYPELMIDTASPLENDIPMPRSPFNCLPYRLKSRGFGIDSEKHRLHALTSRRELERLLMTEVSDKDFDDETVASDEGYSSLGSDYSSASSNSGESLSHSICVPSVKCGSSKVPRRRDGWKSTKLVYDVRMHRPSLVCVSRVVSRTLAL